MSKPVSLNTSDTQYLLQADREALQDAKTPQTNMNGILTLLGGVCIHLLLGTFYLWGAIALYVASYLRSIDDSVTLSQLMSVPPLTIIGLNIGQILGVPLAEKYGFRVVLFASIVTIPIAVGLASLATSFVLFVALYGVLNGFATGIAYMIPIVAGWKHYPKQKGMVSGVTVGAFGFGSFIFNFVAVALVNPDDLKPTDVHDGTKYFTEEVYSRVPHMFVVLSICYVALGLLGAFLVRPPTPEEEARNKAAMAPQGQGQASGAVEETGATSVKEGVFSKQFWVLFLLASAGATFGLFMVSNYKAYGLKKIPEDRFVTLVGSIGAISNGGTRAVWALLFDKFGFKKVYFVLGLIQGLLAITLDSISSNKALYLIWYALIMGCEGGHFSLLPAVTVKIFGLKFGPRIYGIMFWCFAVGTWSAFGMTKLALNVLDWSTAIYIGTAITGVAFVLNFFVEESLTKKNK